MAASNSDPRFPKRQSLVGLLVLYLALWLLAIFMMWQRPSRVRLPEVGFWREDEIEYRRWLPERPRQLPPLDSSRIGRDENDGTLVLLDRINIALKDGLRDTPSRTFAEFVSAIVSKFPPDQGYSILYYDDQTFRLQLGFPEQERSGIVNRVRTSLPQLGLLIWNESIFEFSSTFNDPGLLNRQTSWHLDAIGAPAAWAISTGDTSVTVAVVDNGFDLENPDLNKLGTITYNVVTQEPAVTPGYPDTHGSHVAGLAVARANNGKGAAGVAPGCKLMAIQVSTPGVPYMSYSSIVDGILYAIRNGADVINLSLGKQMDGADQLTPEQQRFLQDVTQKDEEFFWRELFDYASRRKATIVIAAGNENVLSGIDPMRRSDLGIVVGAIDSQSRAAAFTNFGSAVSVCAPGVNVYSCLDNGRFGFLDGTSMASPMVAGTVGLMKSVNPDLTTGDILRILQQTGEPGPTGSEIGVLIRADRAVAQAKAER